MERFRRKLAKKLPRKPWSIALSVVLLLTLVFGIALLVNSVVVFNKLQGLYSCQYDKMFNISSLDVGQVCTLERIPFVMLASVANPVSVDYQLTGIEISCYLNDTLLMQVFNVPDIQFSSKTASQLAMDAWFNVSSMGLNKFFGTGTFPRVKMVTRTVFKTGAFWFPVEREISHEKIVEMSDMLGGHVVQDLFEFRKANFSEHEHGFNVTLLADYSRSRIAHFMRFNVSDIYALVRFKGQKVMSVSIPSSHSDQPVTFQLSLSEQHVNHSRELLGEILSARSFNLTVEMRNGSPQCSWLSSFPILPVNNLMINTNQNANVTSGYAISLESVSLDPQPVVSAVALMNASQLFGSLELTGAFRPLTILAALDGIEAFEITTRGNGMFDWNNEYLFNTDIKIIDFSSLIVITEAFLEESSQGIIRIGGNNSSFLSNLLCEFELPLTLLPFVWNLSSLPTDSVLNYNASETRFESNLTIPLGLVDGRIEGTAAWREITFSSDLKGFNVELTLKSNNLLVKNSNNLKRRQLQGPPIEISLLVTSNSNEQEIIQSLDHFFDTNNFVLNLGVGSGMSLPIQARIRDSLKDKIARVFSLQFRGEGVGEYNVSIPEVKNLCRKAIKICARGDDVQLEKLLYDNLDLVTNIVSSHEFLVNVIERFELPQQIQTHVDDIVKLIPLNIGPFADHYLKLLINLPSNCLPRKLFREFLKRGIDNAVKLLGEIDVTQFMTEQKFNLSHMPGNFTGIMEDFRGRYTHEIDPVIKFDMMSTLINLPKDCSRVDLEFAALCHAGPFLQKMLQWVGQYATNEETRMATKKLKNMIGCMDPVDLKIQLDANDDFEGVVLGDCVKGGTIAQGHLATYNGKPAFVKILRPRLKEKLDYEWKLFEKTIKTIEPIRLQIYSDMHKEFLNELDFYIEYENGNIARNVYHGRIHSVEFYKVFKTAIVMERLEGETLSEIVKTGDANKACVAIDLMEELVSQWFQGIFFPREGSMGFFHGDLQPGNIRIVYNETNPEQSYLALLDYGNAHSVDASGFREMYFNIGTGIFIRSEDAVLDGLGRTPANAHRPEWRQLGQELTEIFHANQPPLLQGMQRFSSKIFESRLNFAESFSYAFDDTEKILQLAIKKIEKYDLPFYPKSVAFFRSKELLEGSIKTMLEIFGNQTESCRPIKEPFEIYVNVCFGHVESAQNAVEVWLKKTGWYFTRLIGRDDDDDGFDGIDGGIISRRGRKMRVDSSSSSSSSSGTGTGTGTSIGTGTGTSTDNDQYSWLNTLAFARSLFKK